MLFAIELHRYLVQDLEKPKGKECQEQRELSVGGYWQMSQRQEQDEPPIGSDVCELQQYVGPCTVLQSIKAAASLLPSKYHENLSCGQP